MKWVLLLTFDGIAIMRKAPLFLLLISLCMPCMRAQANIGFDDDGPEMPVSLSDQIGSSINGMVNESEQLKQILERELDFYIDGSLEYKKTKIEVKKPVPEMLQDMNGIVQAVIEEHTEDAVFGGFSPAVQQQLERVSKLEWSNASFAIDGGSEQDKYLAIYYFVSRQVQDLKSMLHAEIDEVARSAELSPGIIAEETADATSAVFDNEDFMIPLEMQADPYDAAIELEADEPVRIVQPPKRKVRKRDKWLVNELSSINSKIDKLGQKDESEKYEMRLNDLEKQLAEIREMLAEKVAPIVPNTNNPIADLSELTGKNVTVRFEKYSNRITPEFELLLNEVFVELARNAQHKVLITGFADKSGNAKENLRLSELRAQAVKYFFQERGIEGERLLVNYFGDSKSNQKNPDERRVEIEWLIESDY